MAGSAPSAGACISWFVFGFMIAGAANVAGTVPLQARDSSAPAVPAIVLESVARSGLTGLTAVRQRGHNYTAIAQARDGLPAVVVIDGRTGQIIGFRLLSGESERDNLTP